MSIEITLPNEAWQDVEPGTEALVEDWMVPEGGAVLAGQVVASVVVVKTSHDVVAPADGILEKILVPAESTFKPGQALALLGAKA
jgi:pyruvate/2-oxoglutarate dehydrogenase complex dihydrolipoamide acyltransferase (E2) component